MASRKKTAAPAAIESAPGISALILICFFLSGMAGLVYEVVWVRLFDKVIGSAPLAVATILTIFMGGLGIGSYWASRFADRVRPAGRLLVIYGMLECAIGIYGVLVPLLLPAVRPLVGWMYNHLIGHFWVYHLLVFGLCAILLLFPVICMGVTLPVLSRYHIHRLETLGWRAGRLYGINTIGAALGVVLTGFVLIWRWGVWESILAVAAVNLLVGLVCIVLGQREMSAAPVKPTKKRSVSVVSAPAPAPTHGVDPLVSGALVLFAVSGFCSMAYQVMWTRLIGLLLAPTTFSFSIVVAAFIVGLAIGNVIFGRLADRTSRLMEWLVASQLGAALLALLVSQFLGNGQFVFTKQIFHWQNRFDLLMVIQFSTIFGVLLGPTILSGAAFPLVAKIYADQATRIGRSIGRAYAVNTIGAITGSFCGGFIFIPLLGKEGGLKITVAIQALAALLVWAIWAYRRRQKPLVWAAMGATLVLVVAAVSQYPVWNRHLLSYGRYHNMAQMQGDLMRTNWFEAAIFGPALLAEKEGNREVVFYGDGIGGFTTVEKHTDQIGKVRFTMLNSGKPDATSHDDASTQALLAHLPLLFHEAAKSVMILGLGSGMTTGEALHYPVENVDVLEINEEVVKASRLFADWNNHFEKDPRVSVITQDGRHHLSLTRKTYDVIISEPSNPWMAGMANLYTHEFFRTVRQRLGQKGIFIQWIHAGNMRWSTFAMIGKTFADVFSDGLLLRSPIGGADYFLIGIKDGQGLRYETARERLAFANQSQVVNLADARLLYSLVITEDLPRMFADGQTHSDNHPLLEFEAPMVFFTNHEDIEPHMATRTVLTPATKALRYYTPLTDLMLDFAAFTNGLYSPLFPPVEMGNASQDQRARYLEYVRQFCRQRVVHDYRLFSTEGARQECSQIQLGLMTAQLKSDPDNSAIWRSMGIVHARRKEFEAAQTAFLTSLKHDPENAEDYFNLGMVAYLRKDFAEARVQLERTLQKDPFIVKAYLQLAELLDRQGQLKDAVLLLRKGLEIQETPAMRQALNVLESRLRVTAD